MQAITLPRVLAVCLLGWVTTWQAYASTPRYVSVCQLLRAPAQYLGDTVEVVGQTEGRWFESAPLRDRHCRGIGYIELEGTVGSGLDKLRRASRAADGSRLPGVVAVLRGRFEHRTESFPPYVLMVARLVSIGKVRVPSAVPLIPPRKSARPSR